MCSQEGCFTLLSVRSYLTETGARVIKRNRQFPKDCVGFIQPYCQMSNNSTCLQRDLLGIISHRLRSSVGRGENCSGDMALHS